MKTSNEQSREKRKPTLFVAMLPIISMLLIVGIGFPILKLPLTMVLLLSAAVSGLIAKFLGYSWSEMLDSIGKKIGQSTGALFILIGVGLMVGSWMISGTLPMMIYYGIQIINAKFLYVTAFLATAIVSVLTGTSYGSVGSMGIVVMGVASTLGMSLPIAAGATVAGAYFGDKLSPLSDTTVLASAVTNTDLFEHIKHMLWTTVPASLLGLIVYFIAGINTHVDGAVTMELVDTMVEQMDQIYSWNILLLLPVAIVLVGCALKFPTVPVLIGSSVVA